MQFFFSYYSLPVNFLSFPISILSPFLAVKLSELPPYPDIHTCQSLSGISSYYSTEMIHCQGPLNYHVILSSLFCCQPIGSQWYPAIWTTSAFWKHALTSYSMTMCSLLTCLILFYLQSLLTKDYIYMTMSVEFNLLKHVTSFSMTAGP